MTQYAKWTEAKLTKLKELIDERKTCAEVAAAMGLSVGQVERAAYREGWHFNGARKAPPKKAPKQKAKTTDETWAWLLYQMPVTGRGCHVRQ